MTKKILELDRILNRRLPQLDNTGTDVPETCLYGIEQEFFLPYLCSLVLSFGNNAALYKGGN
jgi:hypothetical protein